MQSILDHSPANFRQFVYFGSIAALVRLDAPNGYIFTEKDWNPWTEEVVQGMPEEQLKQIAYFASKTIAERTVWDFVNTHAV